MNNTELAWAAGFFDADGHITCRRDGLVHLTIGQVNTIPLERFKKAVGSVGTIYGPYQPTGLGRQPKFRYEIWGKKAIEVFHTIEPYLCEIKIEQGNDALQKSMELISPKPSKQPYEHGTTRMYNTKKCRCDLCKNEMTRIRSKL